MKKTITLMLALLLGIAVAMADEKIYHNANVLPRAARTMLDRHFSGKAVSVVKVDTESADRKEYDVTLADGTEIEFDNAGNWTDVDCGRNAVPAGLIIKPVADYVKRNHPKAKIVHIEANRSGYEVELNNGVELEFSRDGRFLRKD